MNPRELTPETLAMIALGEGRNAFANLRESHAELLAALKEATRCLEWHEEEHGVGLDKVAVDRAHAAIAKAEGSTE